MDAETFEKGRGRWLAMAYRMVGTRADAEEIVQEAWVRVSQVQEDVRDFEAYTTRVVTRLCLDHLRSARVVRESYVGPWLPEPVRSTWDGGGEDPEREVALAESLKLAFLHTLESLTPMERAVFLLREVFGYDYGEVAALVERQEGACRQIASRARARVRGKRPARVEVGEQARQRLLGAFVSAVATGDVAGLESLLCEDAVLWSDGGGKVHAALRPVYGAQKIGRFFLALARKNRPMVEVEMLNGSPALLFREEGVVTGILGLETQDGEHISEVYIVRNPDKLSGL